MADQQMNIIVSANVNQATQGLNNVSKSLANTAMAAGKTDSALESIGASSYTTRFAVQNLANVFRDLPFAINNPAIGATVIDHVLGSVQALKSETGSLKGAFSAIAGSLSGTGGLLVAMNLLGALFSLFVSQSHDVKKVTDENTKAQKEQAAALLETYKVAGQQYAQVAKLIEQSKLQTTSHEQQKKILQELKSVNEEYFGSLKVEGDTITGLAAAYEVYGNNILRVARAKGAATEIEKLTNQLLQTKDATLSLETNFTNLNLTLSKAGGFLKDVPGQGFEQLANASKKVDEILAKGIPSMQDIKYLSEATGISEYKINHILSDRQQYKTKEAQLTAQIAADSKLVAANDISSVNGIADKVKKLKELHHLTFDPAVSPIDNFVPYIQMTYDHLQAAVDKSSDKIKPIDFNLKLNPKLSKETQSQIDATTALYKGMLENAFVSLGEGLGDALSKGANPFSVFLKILGEGAKTLGKAYVQIGLEALAAKKALSLIAASPYLTIAAGVAMIALGQLLAAKANKIQAFALGGVVTRPTLAMIGEQGPERIMPLGQVNNSDNSGGIVEFRISGQELRGMLKRADITAANTF